MYAATAAARARDAAKPKYVPFFYVLFFHLGALYLDLRRFPL